MAMVFLKYIGLLSRIIHRTAVQQMSRNGLMNKELTSCCYCCICWMCWIKTSKPCLASYKTYKDLLCKFQITAHLQSCFGGTKCTFTHMYTFYKKSRWCKFLFVLNFCQWTALHNQKTLKNNRYYFTIALTTVPLPDLELMLFLLRPFLHVASN